MLQSPVDAFPVDARALYHNNSGIGILGPLGQGAPVSSKGSESDRLRVNRSIFLFGNEARRHLFSMGIKSDGIPMDRFTFHVLNSFRKLTHGEAEDVF